MWYSLAIIYVIFTGLGFAVGLIALRLGRRPWPAVVLAAALTAGAYACFAVLVISAMTRGDMPDREFAKIFVQSLIYALPFTVLGTVIAWKMNKALTRK
ncbi:hypothetical protein [Sphingopyxis sp.]|uniref:hypothetical protein n=1 Tax=Sphingopyxis sp. TaxID=1908224 RepID=UPI0035AEB4A5